VKGTHESLYKEKLQAKGRNTLPAAPDAAASPSYNTRFHFEELG